jgi:chemotaxis protein MotB
MRRTFLKLAVAPAVLGLFGCASMQRYEELESAYRQLQGRYTADEAEIRMLEGRLRVTMTDRILFPSGGYQINEQARATLRKMVPTLQGLTQTRVIVEGYTDTTPVGPELRRMGIASNLDLSSRRADAVADALIREGGPRNLISADGRGEANPVASNATPEGRARNRRIEVTLVGQGN